MFVEQNVVRDGEGISYDPHKHPEDGEGRFLQNREVCGIRRSRCGDRPEAVLPATGVPQRARTSCIDHVHDDLQPSGLGDLPRRRARVPPLRRTKK
ncbi:hypothetical protein [Stackebrandtia soli]|uniref:hypothetical protein n=1 Tax=Stackebrandtia soli TaxID=1892856 RepID=UPI0039EAB30D